MNECPIIDTRRLAIKAEKIGGHRNQPKKKEKLILIGARLKTRWVVKYNVLACLKKRNNVAQQSCEAMLSRLALAEKGASDSYTLHCLWCLARNRYLDVYLYILCRKIRRHLIIKPIMTLKGNESNFYVGKCDILHQPCPQGAFPSWGLCFMSFQFSICQCMRLIFVEKLRE